MAIGMVTFTLSAVATYCLLECIHLRALLRIERSYIQDLERFLKEDAQLRLRLLKLNQTLLDDVHRLGNRWAVQVVRATKAEMPN